jgi:hypothetical protein
MTVNAAAPPFKIRLPNCAGVGSSGTIYFSSDIENSVYKIVKK